MNSNQIKGAAKDAVGKVQRTAGEVTGSVSQQAKGATKQVAGKMQKAAGDVQQSVRDTTPSKRS